MEWDLISRIDEIMVLFLIQCRTDSRVCRSGVL